MGPKSMRRGETQNHGGDAQDEGHVRWRPRCSREPRGTMDWPGPRAARERHGPDSLSEPPV